MAVPAGLSLATKASASGPTGVLDHVPVNSLGWKLPAVAGKFGSAVYPAI